MRASILVALLALIALLPAPRADAIDNIPPLPDPALQQRYLGLTHELRCMQCQNESLADSPVGLASDLRRDVREQLLAGKTDEQIRDHMVARYGEFILLRPRMNWRNAWLWSAPALFMLIVAPIAASLIQLAVSRSREYQADATGAHYTGNPYALASALQKLDAYSRRVPMAASHSTAHLFIIQPLLGMNFGNLFSTHPPIAKRIERLTGRPAQFMQ